MAQTHGNLQFDAGLMKPVLGPFPPVPTHIGIQESPESWPQKESGEHIPGEALHGRPGGVGRLAQTVDVLRALIQKVLEYGQQCPSAPYCSRSWKD